MLFKCPVVLSMKKTLRKGAGKTKWRDEKYDQKMNNNYQCD